MTFGSGRAGLDAHTGGTPKRENYKTNSTICFRMKDLTISGGLKYGSLTSCLSLAPGG